MYVKPPENIQQPQQPARRVARRGESLFQDELLERIDAAEMVDSVSLSDENKKQAKQELQSEGKNKKRFGGGLGKINVEA